MPKSLWFLIIGMLVNVTGASFLWPLNTIYINEHLGKSLSVAGVVLMLNSAASVVGNLLGGTLEERFLTKSEDINPFYQELLLLLLH